MLRFKSSSDFQKEVRKRVRAYFKDENKSSLADYRYYIKAVLNLALYLVPFVFFLTSNWGFGMTTLLWAITGLGMAGVGMNLMHDALHNTVTRSEWWNRRNWGFDLYVGGQLLHMACPAQYETPHAYKRRRPR